MRRKLFAILLCVCMAFVFTACGGYQNLEECLADNPDIETDIVSAITYEESEGGWDVDVSVSENTVTISHTEEDYSDYSDVVADMIREECEADNGESFQEDIDKTIKSIKNKTEMADAEITVNYQFYQYDGTLIWEGTFTESSTN